MIYDLHWKTGRQAAHLRSPMTKVCSVFWQKNCNILLEIFCSQEIITCTERQTDRQTDKQTCKPRKHLHTDLTGKKLTI